MEFYLWKKWNLYRAQNWYLYQSMDQFAISQNRADKYNAMNAQMITELCELFEWTALRSVGKTGELTDESDITLFTCDCFEWLW